MHDPSKVGRLSATAVCRAAESGRRYRSRFNRRRPAERCVVENRKIFRDRGAGFLGNRRVVKHITVQPQAAEPAVGQIAVDLLAQPPLRPSAKPVADDEHPHHQLRIDRRATHGPLENRIGGELTYPHRRAKGPSSAEATGIEPYDNEKKPAGAEGNDRRRDGPHCRVMTALCARPSGVATWNERDPPFALFCRHL